MVGKSFNKLYQLVSCSSVCAFLFVGNSLASPVSNIQEQRALYDRAQKLLDRRQVSQYQSIRKKNFRLPTNTLHRLPSISD